jgi:hypothetical protein
MFGVPHCLLDDNVETTFVPEVVAAYRHTALALISGQPVYSLADLENLHGAKVDDPVLDLPVSRGIVRAPAAAIDVVDFGDGSFQVR